MLLIADMKSNEDNSLIAKAKLSILNFGADSAASVNDASQNISSSVPVELSETQENSDNVELKQDGIIPTSTRLENTSTNIYIYDITDFIDFKNKVNDGDTFSGKTVNLMDDIDLSSVCSSTLGSWIAIGDNNLSLIHI